MVWPWLWWRGLWRRGLSRKGLWRRWLSGRQGQIAPALARFNATPGPPGTSTIAECPILVLDIETTGLDARRDHIVSIGWIPIRQRQVIISEARYFLTRCPISVGQSATVHGVLDRDLHRAEEIAAALTEMLTTYAGYIFAAHHAPLEKAFLQVAMQKYFGGKAKFKFLDTMALERHRLQRQNQEPKQESLQLGNCLQSYGIPPAIGHHHALEDAYQCALLLLAQTSKTRFSLADLLRQSAR